MKENNIKKIILQEKQDFLNGMCLRGNITFKEGNVCLVNQKFRCYLIKDGNNLRFSSFVYGNPSNEDKRMLLPSPEFGMYRELFEFLENYAKEVSHKSVT